MGTNRLRLGSEIEDDSRLRGDNCHERPAVMPRIQGYM